MLRASVIISPTHPFVQLMLLLTVIDAVCTGPTSNVYPTIEPDSDKNLKVTYMPAEVGVYTVTMLWNDVEVVGEFSHGFK